MEHIILLRGVTPNGKNAIPKMSYLVDILTEAGFQQVRTYIQSGPLEKLKIDYGEEEICIGNHCLYLYLPRTAKQKKLHTNYLEKLFNVDLTMRKLNVVEKLLSK